MGDEADPPELGRVLGRPTAENVDGAGARFEQADREMKQRGLTCAVRADQTDNSASRHLQCAVTQGPPSAIALAKPLRIEHGGHATPSSVSDRKES